eukprot:SAG11_NODE_3117_length_2674_cov_2.246214_1_plen_51_part_00
MVLMSSGATHKTWITTLSYLHVPESYPKVRYRLHAREPHTSVSIGMIIEA